MKRVVSLLVGLTLILSLVAPSAFALDGVWHEPYGNNCIYDIGETERIPRNPAEGENVIVKGTTWPIEPGQSVWATYTVNGEPKQCTQLYRPLQSFPARFPNMYCSRCYTSTPHPYLFWAHH